MSNINFWGSVMKSDSFTEFESFSGKTLCVSYLKVNFVFFFFPEFFSFSLVFSPSSFFLFSFRICMEPYFPKKPHFVSILVHLARRWAKEHAGRKWVFVAWKSHLKWLVILLSRFEHPPNYSVKAILSSYWVNADVKQIDLCQSIV